MKIKLSHKFEDVISLENLLEAWQEFAKGKRQKRDVQEFSFGLMDNIFVLHYDLVNHSYKHGPYQVFRICDPKPRIIHKAQVRDRLLHHALHRLLYPFFDRIFIADSFACRLDKGVHRALNRFRAFGLKVSQNNTQTCWVLKGDIKKFFASIDHNILISILKQYIPNGEVIWLCQRIINSFNSGREGIGLPLGNLTSQLFANIYLNKFDQFVKHKIKARHYIRYADDFVIFVPARWWLENILPALNNFLGQELKLGLHQDKIFIKTLSSGIDFLGWAHFPQHRVLRTKTKKRILKKIALKPKKQTLNSYLGLLKHGNTHKVRKMVLEKYLLSQPKQFYSDEMYVFHQRF